MTQRPQHPAITRFGCSIGMLMIWTTIAQSETIESFVEPYRQAAVPAAEIGVLSEVLVVEGDQVSANQLVAKLDDSILQASAKVAAAAMESKGALMAAESDNDSRLQQLASYKQLQEQGNASPREYERALNEQAKAAARLQAAREDLEIRRLEFHRVKAQIAMREIKSPISGHVVLIEKERGEFVSPTDPVVMQVVQLDTLKAIFAVPQQAVVNIAIGQQVDLVVGYQSTTAKAIVDFVSPIADPQSGTVRVKLRIANTDKRLKSGSTCRWDLDSYTPEQQISRTTQPNRQRK